MRLIKSLKNIFISKCSGEEEDFPEPNNVDESENESESSDHSSDEEFKSFIVESSLINNKENCMVVDVHIDENVYNKSDRHKIDTKTVESFDENEELNLNIDFSSMQKCSETKSHTYVVHNDMDLKDLYKSFVRKKNTKFVKVKTDEHSDSDSEKSDSTSTDESDFEIRQGEFFMYFYDIFYFPQNQSVIFSLQFVMLFVL